RPADAASATCVPTAPASAPQNALPMARLACAATMFIPTARARTQEGALLWVPAERLANTVTHATPAQKAPATASAVMPVAAISTTASVHSRTPEVTMAFN